MTIEVPVRLYSMADAVVRFRELTGWSYSEDGLRDRLRDNGIPVHRIGKSDLVAEIDLLRLAQLPKPKRGRPR